MIRWALGFVVGAWLVQSLPELPSLRMALWICAALVLVSVAFVVLDSTSRYQWLRNFPLGRLIPDRFQNNRLQFFRYTLLQQIAPWWIACSLACMLGFLWALFAANQRMLDALPHEWEQKTVALEGVVVSLPQITEQSMRFEFDVERILTPHAKVPSHIVISEYIKPALAPLDRASNDRESGQRTVTESVAHSTTTQSAFHVVHPGERWRLHVRLKQPHGTLNPHGFDFEAWALERNIRAIGTLRAKEGMQRMNAFVWRPSTVIEHVRARVSERMRSVLATQPYAGVLTALAIGDDDAIQREDWLVFLRTGTTHLISISGLHITMLSGMVGWLVYQGWRRLGGLALRWPARKVASLAAVFTALSYALVAGFSIPTQRTLFMLTLFALALWWGKPLPMRNVLAWALVLVVLIDPWATQSPGFWLSFGAVMVMVFALSNRYQPLAAWRAAVKTQWVVTIGLVPALLIMFGQVSIISPLANALAIPLISLLVVPLTLLGALSPMDWPLLLAHFLMAEGMMLLKALSALPLATWEQHAPPVWTWIPATLAMVWLLLPRGFPFKYWAWVGLLPMLTIPPDPPSMGSVKAQVLDVGQGLAVVVQTRHHQLLYDTGPVYSPQSDAGSRIIVPYLRGEGVRQLDGVIVSHDDNDHSGGLPSVLNAVPVGWVATSISVSDDRLTGHRVIPCFSGQRWQWDGVQFEMLGPEQNDAYPSLKDNNKSCVLKVSSAYGSVLIPGDIEREAERSLIGREEGAALSADVLIAPHHGSKTSSTSPFVEAVNPKAVIYTVGYLNRFHHPKPAVMQRYQAIGAEAYRSDYDGAINIEFTSNKGPKISTYRNEAKRYWHVK